MLGASNIGLLGILAVGEICLLLACGGNGNGGTDKGANRPRTPGPQIGVATSRLDVPTNGSASQGSSAAAPRHPPPRW